MEPPMIEVKLNVQEAVARDYVSKQAAINAARRGARYIRRLARGDATGTPPTHIMEKLRLIAK